MFRLYRSRSEIAPTPATCSVEVMVQLSQIVLGTSVLVKICTPQAVGTGVGVLVRVAVLGTVRVGGLVGGVPVAVGGGVPCPGTCGSVSGSPLALLRESYPIPSTRSLAAA